MTKTALVAGGSREIGRAIARRLAVEGFAVVVSYADNAHSVEETVAEIRESKGTAIALRADITNEKEVRILFESALQQFGRLDVIVCDTGMVALSPMARADVETFDQTIRTNLRATFLLFAQAAAHISEDGRIIAFSSTALKKNLPSYGAYTASKAGLEALVRVLANELRDRRITVNAIALCAESEMEPLGASQPQTSLGYETRLEGKERPNDLLHLVAFLAGPDGGWVNGQVVPVAESPSELGMLGPGKGPVSITSRMVGINTAEILTH